MFSLVNIAEKFSQFTEHWHPYIVANSMGST